MSFLAMLVAFASLAMSFERLRRVHRAAGFDFAALSRALGRSGGPARLTEMRDLMLAEGTGWEGELVGDVLEARSQAERTALVNERLGDVASELGWGSRIPVAAARLSALGPLCILFFGLAMGGRMAYADIVAVLGWGGAGVVGALATGREAERVAAGIRRDVDAWVARVLDEAQGEKGEAVDR